MCIACNSGLRLFSQYSAPSRRGFLKVGASLGSAAVAASPLVALAGAVADTIFINAVIITMDDAKPFAQAIAIRQGRILAIGSDAEVLASKGATTHIVDLQGKTLTPGFIDPHVHLTNPFNSRSLDLGPFTHTDMKGVMASLKMAIANLKPGEWLAAQALDRLITPGDIDVSIQNLDRLAPDNPVIILESNGHVAYVNSLACKLAGVTQDTPDPDHGRYVRDKNGQLTGELQEVTAFQAFVKVLPKPSSQQYLKDIADLMQHCAKMGCTLVNDCGIGVVMGAPELQALGAVTGPQAAVRVSGFLVSTSFKIWEKLGLKPDHKNEYLRINGIKAWVDGSNQAGSGYQRVPYKVTKWAKGHANYTPAQLQAVVQQAHDADWQVAVHANGDAAIDMALDAFETAQKNNPKADLRHRIEHSSLSHSEQLDRMKRLNVSPSFLMGHVYFWGQVFRDQTLGAERANLLDPCHSALAKGLKISLHSDYNTTPINPLRCMHNAIARTMRGTTQVLNAAEKITPMQALRAVTLDAAWQCHMDDLVGSLEVGKAADFVILDKNPLTIPAEDLLNLKVSETWMNGVQRYQS